MPKNRMILNKKKYVFCSYVGTSKSFIGRIICKIKAIYWDWRLNRMKEGEILERYYKLTTRSEDLSLWLKD